MMNEDLCPFFMVLIYFWKVATVTGLHSLSFMDLGKFTTLNPGWSKSGERDD